MKKNSNYTLSAMSVFETIRSAFYYEANKDTLFSRHYYNLSKHYKDYGGSLTQYIDSGVIPKSELDTVYQELEQARERFSDSTADENTKEVVISTIDVFFDVEPPAEDLEERTV